jgi:hypothetical protein
MAQQREQRLCTCLPQQEHNLVGEVRKQGEVHVIADGAQLGLQARQECLHVLGRDAVGIFCCLVQGPYAVCMTHTSGSSQAAGQGQQHMED